MASHRAWPARDTSKDWREETEVRVMVLSHLLCGTMGGSGGVPLPRATVLSSPPSHSQSALWVLVRTLSLGPNVLCLPSLALLFPHLFPLHETIFSSTI